MVLEHGQSIARKAAKQGAVQLQIYDPKSFRSPHVYNRDRRHAILVIDMLNDFVTGSLKCERAIPMVNPLSEFADRARTNDLPVLYCNDSHRETDFEIRARWAPHAMRGTKGADVIKELAPTSRDQIVPKTTYSSFYATDIDDILQASYNGRGANTLILTGLHTDCCVRHTTADAFFRGYESIIVKDGVNSFTEVQHSTGLQYLQFWYNAEIVPSKDLVKRLF